MSLAPGSKVGPYEILAQIGAGGMSEDIESATRDLTASSRLGINTIS
jgi:hypothetical protein